ncbi:MAG: DUF3122 domain-containing protein [Cyanobacteria bacterium J06648_16]
MQTQINLLIAFMVFAALLWAAVLLSPRYRFLARVVQLFLLTGLSLLLMGWWFTPVAAAEIQFFKAADQWIYQAQQQLTDTSGTQWEVTALKQMQEDNPGVYLRFVTTFPGVDLDAARPLQLETPTGKQLTATNVTQQYFVGELPAPNLGQFDIQPLIQQLKGESSLQVQIPTRRGPDVTLSIPSSVLEEWTAVGSCQYLMCDT